MVYPVVVAVEIQTVKTKSKSAGKVLKVLALFLRQHNKSYFLYFKKTVPSHGYNKLMLQIHPSQFVHFFFQLFPTFQLALLKGITTQA